MKITRCSLVARFRAFTITVFLVAVAVSGGCGLIDTTKNETTSLTPSSAAARKMASTGKEWDVCASNLEARMRQKGYSFWCGNRGGDGGCVADPPDSVAIMSNSLEDSLLDLKIKECGYKPHTEEETRALTFRIRKEGLSPITASEVDTYPPDHPIHVVANEIGDKEKKRYEAEHRRWKMAR